MPKSRLTRGLRDQIAEELRRDIVAGRFAPGVQMVERQLAHRFGVSHAPIREALLLLAHEGYLVAETNRGAQVAPRLSPTLRRFFMALRTALETFALRSCISRLSEEDLLVFEQLLRDFQRAREQHDWALAAQRHYAFHEAIVGHSEQADVISAWRSVVARARLYHAEWVALGSHSLFSEGHARIISACRNRDIHDAQQSLDDTLRLEAGAMTSEEDSDSLAPSPDHDGQASVAD
jgi:GntR family transcriptional regulator, rspAB operon transcriptional repressor